MPLSVFALTAVAVSMYAQVDPGIPVPTLPADGEVSYMPTPDFFWSEVEGAEEYEIQIAGDPSFESIIDRDHIVIPRYVADKPLPWGGHYWRVRSYTADGEASAFSEPVRFELKRPENIYEIPDGADAQTIQSIIAEAVKNTPALVQFAVNGHYRLTPVGQRELIKMKGVENLIVDGRGSTVVLTSALAGLAEFINCKSILVRDITVEFDPMPFTVGVIEAVDEDTRTITMRMDNPGMIPFDQPLVQNHWEWGVLLDGDIPGKLADDAPIVMWTEAESVARSAGEDGEPRYTVRTSKSYLPYFKPGLKWIQFVRAGGGSLFRTDGSEDVTAYEITNYGISAGHYAALGGTRLKVLHCHSRMKEGNWFGNNADGLHVRSNKIGPWVEGCSFEGVGDDAIAFYSKGIYIFEQVSDRTLLVDRTMFNLEPGDRATIFDPRAGTLVEDEIVVESVQPSSEVRDGVRREGFLVTFTEPFKAQIETSNEDPLKNDQLFGRERINHYFAIRHSNFSKIRRYGNVIRGAHGVIEGNTYEHISDVAINLRNEPDLWRNGLHSEKIWILDNTILDSGFSRGSYGQGQIQAIMYRLGYANAEARAHRDIVIAGNTILNWQECAIRVSNVDGARIVDNTVGSDLLAFDNDRRHVGILVDNSENVWISGNEFIDPRTLDAEIEVTENTDNIVQE
ncbi:right-handed parallel beta-helix repeat-containing protein [Ruficoccus amylovorans]|uniref:Right-handed parallel beta-helix repeat-containing protein n=1 Tax=Ruficoccus amylovorans TaxID=1804625 RepID=A0A842HGB8_9BACT|nr:right-handed parallel beta-helix repeat-containing protein [Ruficoccus amylovorans]MBC2595573.1 right-handed parallel beta-helix repeat-containing protein [Ruficoccus amylovorans]